MFDQTLRHGLTVQLEQSPFLTLVSEQRIQQVLRLMSRPAETRITPEIAREICQRTGGTAVLEGSITGLGKQYVLWLRASNCETGAVLGPGAGSGGSQRGGPERAFAHRDSDQEPPRRVAGHHPGAFDAAGTGNHVVTGSSESLQLWAAKPLTRRVVLPASRTFSAPSPSIRNSPWLTAICPLPTGTWAKLISRPSTPAKPMRFGIGSATVKGSGSFSL